MTPRWRSLADLSLLLAAMSFFHVAPASASSVPRWSMSQLAGFSDAIVIGRVQSVRAGWDPAVGAIYTYVSVDVGEVIKGAITPGRITIKQLGGASGPIGLQVFDQPVFAN